MRTYTKRGLSTFCLMGLLSGCATDHLADPIRPDRQPEEHESYAVPKAESVVRVAQMTAARGDWPIAASLFKRAHSIDPKNFDAIYGLARTLNKLNANDDALNAFQQAVALRPKDPDALRGLGNTLVFLDQSASAIQHFERALVVKEDPRLYNGIAVAYDMIDDYKAAQAYYRVGLKSSPTDPSLRNNLALSLLLSGNSSEAAELFRGLVGQPSATKRHRLNYALSLVLLGDTRMAERVVRLDLDKVAASDQIAFYETIKSLGNTKDARAAIRAHIRGGSNEFMHPRRKAHDKMSNK